jgi:hypothetical protein
MSRRHTALSWGAPGACENGKLPAGITNAYWSRIAMSFFTEVCAELMQLEEDMWRERTRYDLAFQERRFAPDFIEFGRSGQVYTREQSICTDPQQILAVLPLSNLSIRLLDTNTAQVTYDSQVTRAGNVQYAHRSSIWSRIEGVWVMRFHQGTPYVPDQPAPGITPMITG